MPPSFPTRRPSDLWLLTVPVDVVDVNDGLVRSLRAAGPGGAWAEDDDGPQPLVALWPVEILRTEVAKTVASGDFAVHALQARMGMMPVRLAGLRFGNLNKHDDPAGDGSTPCPGRPHLSPNRIPRSERRREGEERYRTDKN